MPLIARSSSPVRLPALVLPCGGVGERVGHRGLGDGGRRDRVQEPGGRWGVVMGGDQLGHDVAARAGFGVPEFAGGLGEQRGAATQVVGGVEPLGLILNSGSRQLHH